jgi:membrane associated rhomboid family serine protease/Flp pilus assembly protein TadD
MTVCPQCGREREESRAAGASTCPECQANIEARPAPSSAGPLLTTRKTVPVTLVLVAINVLFFLAMVVKGGSLTHPTTGELLRWGANFGPFTIGGQWWRLLTAMFVHIGIVHLGLNMWCLWELGLLAEYLYGPKPFLALYLLSGLAASLVSVAHNPVVVSAGASGAIFGLAGALIATLFLAKLPAPRNALRTSLISLLVFAGYNLAYGAVKGGIDNGAHVGGLIAGLLLGSVLSLDFPREAPRRRQLRRLAFPVFALLLLGSALVIRHVHLPVVRFELAGRELRQGDTAGALRELKSVVKARPDYAPAWLLMGMAYQRNHEEEQAEAALRRASELDPKNPAPLAQLGVMFLRSGRYEMAREQFQQMTVVDPKNAEAQVNLGVSLNLLGHSAEALASFRQATVLNPKMPLAWYNLGLASMNLKHYDDAVEAFKHTTELAPKDAEAWIWLANAYQAKGMTEEADAAYMKGYNLRSKTRPRGRRVAP